MKRTVKIIKRNFAHKGLANLDQFTDHDPRASPSKPPLTLPVDNDAEFRTFVSTVCNAEHASLQTGLY